MSEEPDPITSELSKKYKHPPSLKEARDYRVTLRLTESFWCEINLNLVAF